MEYIRVSNLRSLSDSTRIEIKPLNLLVGANSSGKSTFLRTFPLLKQSHEMRTLGGLTLNEGDVDFGFFNEALHRHANPAELRLEFGFPLKHSVFKGASLNNYLLETFDASCELTYVKRSKDPRYPRLRVARLTLRTATSLDAVSISADEDGAISELKVNGFLASSDERALLKLQIARGVIPQLILSVTRSGDGGSPLVLVERGTTPFDKRLLAETSTLFHGRTSEETRLATLQSVEIGSPSKMLENMARTGGSFWRERVSRWTVESSPYKDLRNLLIARTLTNVLDSVNLYVNQMAKSIFYFQPNRATAQRDYLSRDVSVASVDSSGANVAIARKFARDSQEPLPTMDAYLFRLRDLPSKRRRWSSRSATN